MTDHTQRPELIVAVAVLLALGLVLGMLTANAYRNAAKTERQSIACIQQGGAWIEYHGDCIYSRRVQP